LFPSCIWAVLNLGFTKMLELNKDEENIVYTLAYYNALDYFPTRFFLWRNLIDVEQVKRGKSFLETEKLLDSLIERGLILEKNGFLLLRSAVKEREFPVKLYRARIWKNKISAEKIKMVRGWSRVLIKVPYLREMLLVGTLMLKNSDKKSDWDVISIMGRNRIWLGRFFLSLWLQLLGKRRTDEKVEDRFCLNQFLVDGSLVSLERSQFMANELLLAIPLLSGSSVKDKIIKSNMFWLQKIKPNFKYYFGLPAVDDKISRGGISWFELILEKLGLAGLMNNWLKKIMIKRILSNPKTYLREADIRFGDFYLIFLPEPRRNKLEIKARALTKRL